MNKCRDWAAAVRAPPPTLGPSQAAPTMAMFMRCKCTSNDSERVLVGTRMAYPSRDTPQYFVMGVCRDWASRVSVFSVSLYVSFV